MVPNKTHLTENQGSHQNAPKPPKEELHQKPEKAIPDANNNKKTIKNQKSPQITDETDPQLEESQAENDIFLSESVGIDVSVDSTALKQFDYHENVDLNK